MLSCRKKCTVLGKKTHKNIRLWKSDDQTHLRHAKIFIKMFFVRRSSLDRFDQFFVFKIITGAPTTESNLMSATLLLLFMMLPLLLLWFDVDDATCLKVSVFGADKNWQNRLRLKLESMSKTKFRRLEATLWNKIRSDWLKLFKWLTKLIRVHYISN